jgi:predicted oxidoreductase
MKYLQIGSLDASRIGVGCMRIADMDQNALSSFVHTALEQGINFFDHADIYGKGQSEAIFGELLRKDPSLRDRMILQSKCVIHDGMYDASYEYIMKSVDGILSRLSTDHIDILLLHRPDALMEPEEVARAFDELEQSGKVLQFGISNMNRFQIELLAHTLKQKLCANQLQMSLAHCPSIEEGINVNTMYNGGIVRNGGILEYCRINDMAVETWSPLQKGFFGGVFLNDPEYGELNTALNELAEKYQVSPDSIAYAWLLRYPAKMQVITGTTNPARIVSAAAAAEITLTRAEWYRLYKAAGRTLP